MYTITKIRLTVLAVTLAATQLIGCASDPQRSGSSYLNGTDAAFESGAERPPTGRTLCLMARILAHQGKLEQAQFVLRRVINEHPDFMLAYCDLAQLQTRDGRVNDAIQLLTTALERQPNDPILLNNLGLCLMMNDQIEDALGRFWEAAALRPRDARYRANVAVALGLLGRYDESLQAYEGAVSDMAQAHYNLAVLCEARRDYVTAVQQYIRAGDLDRSLDIDNDLDRVQPLADRIKTRNDS